GTSYHWRARASNAAGNGDWSGAWQFTTAEESLDDVLDEVLDSLLNIVENPLGILPLNLPEARLVASEEAAASDVHSNENMVHEVELKSRAEHKTEKIKMYPNRSEE